MRASQPAVRLSSAFVLVALLIGCRTTGGGRSDLSASIRATAAGATPVDRQASVVNAVSPIVSEVTSAPTATPVASHSEQLVQPVSLTEPNADDLNADELAEPIPQGANEQPAELQLDWLVAEVLTRHPDVRSAAAAWRAAAERYPQEVALDDPMFGTMLGPGSWGDPTVDSAYMVEASQKLPWPGKRQLRGNIAQAEANAAYFDVGEERLRIAEAARMAYLEFFLAHRELAILSDSTSLLQSFRQTAQAKYESAEVEQQDVLLADVELAELERRQLEVNRKVRVSRARINTLLLLPPDATLPPPPAELPAREEEPSAESLRSLAISQRPELAAQEARIRAERYAVSLACKEFYPDIEVVGRYDAFWQEDPLRPMVGMNLNMPLYKEKRWAAVREARARVVQEQASLESRINEITFEVEQAYQRLAESRQSLLVYQERLLPTARQSVDSARASYDAGSMDFLRLVSSQRESLSIQEYHKRLAELDRAIGTPPPALN
jgi:cobalt-zinc-cadmium efflux system outer membrane protein